MALMSLVAIAACSHRTTGRTAPVDPFVNLGFSQIPVSGMAGGGALLFPVGGILFGDSLAGLTLRRGDLLDRATAVLDSVLARDGREVTWHDREGIRRALRRAPGLAVDPTGLPTGFLLAKKVEGIPDPLWSSIRTLGALTGARVAVIPVAVRLDGRTGAVSATYAVAVVDVRMGQLAWRGKVTGPDSPTPEAALTAAAAAAVPSGIR
jgi:hypothetical protein